MRKFLMTTKKLTEDEAISLITVGVDFGITQVVDGNWGVHAVIRRISSPVARRGPNPVPMKNPRGASRGDGCQFAPTAALFQDHLRERVDVGLQHDQEADEAASAIECLNTKRRIVLSCPYQLVAVEATTIDCASIICHHASGGVGGGHQHRDRPSCSEVISLQIAEQDVRRRIRSRQRHAEPAEQRPKKG